MASTFGKHVHRDDDEVDRAVSPPPMVVVSPISESPAAELQPFKAIEKAALLTPDDASGTSESTNASASPILTVSPPAEPSSASPSPAPSPTPVSGDIILPLMIFAVVKANPPHLVSHLLFTQRFRREHAAGGEEGYCLINLMAVAEFLENVDLAALGLGESEKMVIRYVSALCAFGVSGDHCQGAAHFRICCAVCLLVFPFVDSDTRGLVSLADNTCLFSSSLPPSCSLLTTGADDRCHRQRCRAHAHTHLPPRV